MFSQGGLFLVKILFQSYIMMLMLRVFLQYYKTNYYNPISQVVVSTTDPLVKPIQSYFPGFKGVDLGIVFLALIFEIAKVSIILIIGTGGLATIGQLLLISFVESVSDLKSLLFYLLIGRVILSWIQSPQMGPIQEICYIITEPLMSPIRRILPSIGGIDLSAFIVLFLIQLFDIMVLNALTL